MENQTPENLMRVIQNQDREIRRLKAMLLITRTEARKLLRELKVPYQNRKSHQDVQHG